MSEFVKPCPFCGSSPEVKVRAYYYPPNCYVSASISCLSCRTITDNSSIKEHIQVRQSVFWVDDEILKYVPDGLQLGDPFDTTTAKAAKASARQIVIDLWQRRYKDGRGCQGQ